MTTPLLRATITTAIVLSVALAIVVAQNVAIALYLPHLGRLATDFSPAYLRREIGALAARPHDAVFFGDSVLWGYRLPNEQTAVSLLAARGCACTNLAFKSGNPPNDYALARIFHARGVRPRIVVLEVNQKVLSEADPEYRTLHPGVAALADAYLTSADRAVLDVPRPSGGIGRHVDDALARAWLLYAMRADVRGTLYHDADPPATPVTAAMYEGSYDLTPLTARNVGVRFLEQTVASLRADGIPVLAFLTPTNHMLLHEYIDSPQYAANGVFLRRLLQRRGARVVDLDRAFPAREFIDNDHLTAAGQRRLAAFLDRLLHETRREQERPQALAEKRVAARIEMRTRIHEQR